jgi:hypothetical protein
MRANLRHKNRIALASAFVQYPPMLAKFCSAAVSCIEAYRVEVEVDTGYGDTIIVMLSCKLPSALGPLRTGLKSEFHLATFAFSRDNCQTI